MNKLLLNYFRHFPIDYGKHLLINHIKLPEEVIYYTGNDGVKYKLDPRDHVMSQIYLRGVYEKNTIRHLLKLIKPGDIFVDVGTNIGAYSLVIGKNLPTGKVISFEPNPKALAFLEENIKLNKLNNIQVNKMGLSDKNETAVLFTPSLTTASINKHQNSGEKSTIELTTLDEFCEKNNITNIDILKIDIEGHEFKCLEGAKDIISKSKKMILIMEIDDNCLNIGMKKEDLFNYVIQLGFKAFLPKGYPFSMKEVNTLPNDYKDNIIFIKK